MHLMVYAAYGRSGIYMLQEYCRRLGVVASEKEIEDLFAVLKELPHGHPLDYLLRESLDFRQPGALADALLNPRERAYTVPELYDYIDRCGLAFGLTTTGNRLSAHSAPHGSGRQFGETRQAHAGTRARRGCG